MLLVGTETTTITSRPAGGGQQDHRHVVDVDRLLVVNVACGDAKSHVVVDVAAEPKNDNDGAAGAENSCVVCTEPMTWVAIGRCGHGVVCSKCMVETRFFEQNKRCCICKTHCPKVLVTKADGAGDKVATLLKLPRFSFRDGRVGKHWYHGYTKAYFEDEKEYQAARAACEGIVRPFYYPLCFCVSWFGFLLINGALMGFGNASEAENLSSKVRAYVLSPDHIRHVVVRYRVLVGAKVQTGSS